MKTQPSEQEYEEFLLLMSMALDELLDDEETTRFQQYQTRYPALLDEWQAWQQLDQQMTAMPHVIPEPNFVDRFEVRLVQQERRQRLWQGLWIGMISLLLWTIATTGIISIGTYLFVNQSTWMGDMVRSVTVFFASMGAWLSSLSIAFNSFVATPQAMSLGIGYLVLTMAMLAGWFIYLRRSTQLIETADVTNLSEVSIA